MFNNLRIVSILFQGSVAFVGLSIFLGRTYFITYFDTLGIPTTDVSHNVTEYSIIAATVPLISILVVSMPVIAFLAFEPMQDKKASLPKIVFGAAVATLAGLAILLFPHSPGATGWARQLPEFLNFFGLGFVPLGVAQALNGLSFQTAENHRGWKAALSIGTPALTTGVVILLTVILVLFAAFNLTQLGAEAAARKALMEAPRAHVELKQSAQSLINDIEGCPSEAGECVYKVILIGDHFVYLVSERQESPSESDSSVLQTRYAVPASDISYFTYLPEK